MKCHIMQSFSQILYIYIYIYDYISYRRDISRENISENLLLKRLPLPLISLGDRLFSQHISQTLATYENNFSMIK